jgi:hypothetical protein
VANKFIESIQQKEFTSGAEVMALFNECKKYWSHSDLIFIGEDFGAFNTATLNDEAIILAFLENNSLHEFIEDSKISKGGGFKFKITV